MSGDSSGIDEIQLIKLCLEYGIPFAFMLCIVFVGLSHTRGQLNRVPLWVITSSKRFHGNSNPQLFRRIFPLISIGFLVLVCAAFVQLIAWGIALTVFLGSSFKLVGVCTVFICAAFVMLFHGFFNWQRNNWRMTQLTGHMMIASLICFVVTGFVITFFMEETALFGISVIFLTLNFMFVMELVSKTRPDDEISPFKFVKSSKEDLYRVAISTEHSEKNKDISEEEFEGMKSEIISKARDRKTSEYRMWLYKLYCPACVVLIAYIFTVATLQTGGQRLVGLYVASAVWILDACLFIFLLSKWVMTETQQLLVLAGSRTILIAFGFRFWFLGFCSVFVLAGWFLTYAIVHRHLLSDTSAGNGGKPMTFSTFLDPNIMKKDDNIDEPQKQSCWIKVLRHPITPLSLLSLCFGVSVLVSAITDQNMVRLYDTFHSQAVFGAVSAAAVLVGSGLQATWRSYVL
eukprot:939623_1